METLLSLTLRLVDDDVLSLPRAIAAITSEPARILGTELGQLSEGAPADICIFDPDTTWTVDAELLRSNGTNTPFDGWTLPGKVRWTLVAGQVRYEDIPTG